MIHNTDVLMAGYTMTFSGNGRFGIGITTPSSTSKVHIRNTDITGGAGVLVEQNNTGATHGLSVINASGVATTAAIRGEHTHTSNQVYGVAGVVNSSNSSSAAILGFNQNAGYGVFGQNTGASGGYGVVGVVGAVGGNGSGVEGRITSNNGFGVSGVNAATNGPAAAFVNTTITSLTNVFTSGFGGRGEGVSAIGRRAGVLADASATPSAGYAAVGVWTTAGFFNTGTPTNQFGLVAEYSWEGFAVYGQTWDALPLGSISLVSGVTDVGIFGDNSDLEPWGIGYAGYFNGYVEVNGDLVATGLIFAPLKLFLIDHPQDPEHKYLRHFCAEGPEPNTFYRGVVKADSKGEAIVELPPYFEALNTDFSYHLTPIGDWANLYVKEKIRNNRFVIGGAKPGMEISWLVIAKRNDPTIQQMDLSVEIPKEGRNVGKYLNPAAYGKDESYRAYFKRPYTSEESNRIKQELLQKKQSGENSTPQRTLKTISR